MSNGTNCDKVLKKLVSLFARYGLPDVLVSDGGPPFNAYGFVDFLKRQGINVLKSPPYNPSSNGQAERLVRTVKDVLKKFITDPEFSHLDVEDQINLFLINYRNNCLNIDGNYPSQRIFCYKPKTMLDLLNPKAHYKKFLKEAEVHDGSNTLKNKLPVHDDVLPKDVGNSNNNSTDPFENLTPGDDMWYKNHNPHHVAKWLKANFIKRLSRNTFQVEIGSVPTMAHRGQLRIRKGGEFQEKPNIHLVRRRPDRGPRLKNVDQEGFRGFTDDELRRGRKRSFPVEVPTIEPIESPEFIPRRSKRLRRANQNSEYVYL